LAVGAILVALQVYLLGVAWVHVAERMSWAEGSLLVAAAVIVVLQAMWVVRHRQPAARWKSYPATFVGLMVVGVLLAPLLLGGI
jgi:hypothetical protein